MPAVSIRSNEPYFVVMRSLIGSRVVNSWSLTNERLAFMNWLSRVDLPALGLPTIATLGTESGSSRVEGLSSNSLQASSAS